MCSAITRQLTPRRIGRRARLEPAISVARSRNCLPCTRSARNESAPYTVPVRKLRALPRLSGARTSTSCCTAPSAAATATPTSASRTGCSAFRFCPRHSRDSSSTSPNPAHAPSKAAHGNPFTASALVGRVAWAWIAFAVWYAWWLAVGVRRARMEDAALRQEFGKEWDAYARAVPWWFFPGLL